MSDTGRPEHTEEQYQIWLDEMRPFLEMGCTLNRAVEKTGLTKHRTALYEKYKLNDWFSDKIDIMRSIPGELANEVFARMVFRINDKVKREENITRDDIDILKHFTQYHRSSQPFFVSRHEVAQMGQSEVGKILDILEIPEADYSEFAESTKPIMEIIPSARSQT